MSWSCLMKLSYLMTGKTLKPLVMKILRMMKIQKMAHSKMHRWNFVQMKMRLNPQ